MRQKGELDYSFIKNNSKGLVGVIETVRGKFNELFVENYDSSFNKYLLNKDNNERSNGSEIMIINPRGLFLFKNWNKPVTRKKPMMNMTTIVMLIYVFFLSIRAINR